MFWLLALVLLASLAGIGYRQGVIRVAFSFVGILAGALLAGPLAKLAKPLLVSFGVKTPVLAWLLAPVAVFLLVSVIFKVAGYMVTEGMVRRGAKVRLLRDNVVIHEGALKTLRRFKEEVREVKQGFECGMAFENYSDIKVGDQIECFEIVEEARTL